MFELDQFLVRSARMPRCALRLLQDDNKTEELIKAAKELASLCIEEGIINQHLSSW